jgi:hypothetical protein
VVSNLSSNGSLHNGIRLVEPRQLSEGDEIRIGFRRMHFRHPGDDAAEPARPSAADAGEVAEPEEKTDPNEETAWRWRRDLKALAALQEDHEPTSRTTLDLPHREMFTPRTLEAIQTHTCPRCQRVVSFFDDTCPSCGYAWPPGHPSKNTQEDRDGERQAALGAALPDRGAGHLFERGRSPSTPSCAT